MDMGKTKKLKGKGKKPEKHNLAGRQKKGKKDLEPESQLERLGEDDGVIDFETLVHNEYTRLHRQYRIMEDARRHIAGKSKGVSLQGRRLVLLEAERENLETNLSNADSPTWHLQDMRSIKTVLGILEITERSHRDIQNLMRNVQEMVSNVDQITKRLVAQKLKVQAIFGFSMSVPQAERRKSKLENALYFFTTKYDTTVSQNKAIREEVNMMLKLRTIFYERFISVKSLLSSTRSRMSEFVYLATHAYDSRDDFVFKINLLREKNDKECRQHVLEMKEFTRVLHNDAKLHGFMGLKNKERELMESNQQRTERKNLLKLLEMDQTLASYHKSLKQILTLSKFDTMQRLVASYNRQEQENFTMFKFTTDLHHEVTSLTESTAEVQSEIDQIYLASKNQELKWRDQLLNYGSEFHNTEDLLDSIVDLWENAEGRMSQVLQHLESVFTCAQCSNTSIIRLLGHSSGINPNNALICISVLESRVSELLLVRSQLDLRRAMELEGSSNVFKKVPAQPNIKHKSQGGPYMPQVIVAGRLDGDEDEENEEDKMLFKMPLSYRDLKAQVLEKMAMPQLMKSPEEEPELSPDESNDSEISSASSVHGKASLPARSP